MTDIRSSIGKRFASRLRTSIASLLLVPIVSLAPLMAQAKRVPPKDIPPIKHQGRIITTDYEGTEDGYSMYVIATSPPEKNAPKKTGSEKNGWEPSETPAKMFWRTKIYSLIFEPDFERDVQTIFLTDLSLKGKRIEARDEMGRSYVLDVKTGALLKPDAPAVYDRRGLNGHR